MPSYFDPLASDFETQEQADSHDLWFRERVRASLNDPQPTIPHNEVMTEMRVLLDAKKRGT